MSVYPCGDPPPVSELHSLPSHSISGISRFLFVWSIASTSTVMKRVLQQATSTCEDAAAKCCWCVGGVTLTFHVDIDFTILVEISLLLFSVQGWSLHLQSNDARQV